MGDRVTVRVMDQAREPKVKTLVSASAFFLFQAVSTVGMAAEGPSARGGMAIGDLWEASAAEYQASIEALLEQIGARTIEQADLGGSMMADFLRMFGGGGGAPLDLVRPSAATFSNE